MFEFRIRKGKFVIADCRLHIEAYVPEHLAINSEANGRPLTGKER